MMLQVLPFLPWDELYAPFRQAGTETVLTCSPTGVLLHTASADVITQITERRNDFPKPTYMYSMIDIYGKSAISVEGQLWKKHRKVITAPFNERNYHVVWEESIHQTQEMLSHVIGSEASSASLEDVEELTSRTALATISQAGYAVRIDWPESNENQARPKDEGKPTGISVRNTDWVEGKTSGHKMSYANAIFSVSTDVMWLFVFRRSILKYFPFKSARRASQAYIDWGQYMREMITAKRDELNSSVYSKQQGTDLLTNLIKSAQESEHIVQDQSTGSGKIGVDGFSDDEIMGNAFLLIMAGHETTAGVLHFALLLLAMHVDSQRRLQMEIDNVFGGKPPSEWDYERDFTPAFNGMIGAVLSEVLRWMPPVPGIPKWAPTAQSLNVNGEACTVPKDTVIALHVPAAHRNPNQWPHGKPSNPQDLEYERSNSNDDLGEFRPERWLLNVKADRSSKASNEESVQSATGTAPGLYRPRRGAYLPFSQGARACIGRRFSQVEIIGILAVIFQRYGVELAVDEWASDEEVEKMNDEQRRELWCKARASAKWKLRTKMQALMTNRMVNAHVPIRFVRRGKERFDAEGW
ncbi:hypothetical protein B7494_g4640 [Chlorociboria aeruginascens]|nr:hypothetical protein B7494_g4640 [Chlorociboria aeruginascens]